MYIKVTTHNSPPSYRLPQKIHHNYTIIHSKYFSVSDWLKPGAYPGIFFWGGALVSCSTSTPINHIVFFILQNTSCIRKPQVIGGGGVHTPCTLPLDPPLGIDPEKAYRATLTRSTTRLPYELTSQISHIVSFKSSLGNMIDSTS